MERVELTSARAANRPFLERVERQSGVRVEDCYQCGKCSAGCPIAFAMDYTPHQIMRMLQLGLGDEAMKSHTVWLCSGCETCVTRCPREVDVPRIMDVLRMEAKRAGVVKEKNVDVFYSLFLDSVRKNGRVHEMMLAAWFNLRSGQLFKDVLLAPVMFLKGKISPFPQKAAPDAVQKIFAKAQAWAGGDKH